MHKTRHLSLITAIALVIANMIGSGVYTSLGFQLMDFQNNASILLLWLVGGIIALSGALVYAELAVVFPNNGGEMNFLGKLYGPSIGFLAGWISMFAGFAAPVAIVCIAIGNYASTIFPGISPITMALMVLMALTILHASKNTISARFQQMATLLNLLIILFIIATAFILSIYPLPNIAITRSTFNEITQSGKFPVNLYWVLYAYTGWNAAAYIAGEIKKPARNLPIALLVGTILVTLLYLLLNYAFLLAAPASALKGQMNVGFIAANYLYGKNGAVIMSIFISITLMSTASAMTMAGPRVNAEIGKEIHFFRYLQKQNKEGIPYLAVFTQSGISLLLIWLNQFQLIIDLIGFLLSICTSLAVAGIFIVRKNKEKHFSNYKTPLYPFTPLIFLAINAWIIYYGISLKPLVSAYGLLVILLGMIIWKINKQYKMKSIIVLVFAVFSLQLNAQNSTDIANGLKEALTKGAVNSTNLLSKPDGFFANAAIKILLPPEAKKIENTLRNLGMGKQVDDAILSMNRAAEDACKNATPIFTNAIKQMTVTDAMGILKGSDTAATAYLQQKTSTELTASFRPVIEKSLESTDATKQWNSLVSTYNKFSLKKINPDLAGYVTEKSLSGIFTQIAIEEQNIRKNPVARTSDLLKKVFGN
jgi:APA family basic amino acid/polyamine antiporter